MMPLLAFAFAAALALWLGRIITRSVRRVGCSVIESEEGRPSLPSGTSAKVNPLVAELRESENQLRLITDNAPVGIVHLDAELHYKFFNKYHADQLRKRFGHTPEQVIGKRVPEIFSDETLAIVEPYIRECLAGKAVEFDIELPFEAGQLQFIHCRLEPEWRDGQVVGLVSANIDMTRLKRAEIAFREGKDRLQLALNAAQLGWWQYDPLRRLILVDTRLKEIFDFTADKTTLEEFIARIHPDDVERVLTDREAALDPVDPKPYAHEYRIRRRDGEVRWVEAHGLAYFEGIGHERRVANFIGTVADITERKERDEKEQFLMREINHRAKNMLSVVHSIAQQTATKNPKDFVKTFSERIQALAANQDLLVRNRWKGVEVEDLVHAQLAQVANLIGSRVAVRGPKVLLRAASAQAIGLALHELATNAGKYGALSTDTGGVDIDWAIASGNFTMNWTEHDGPPVSAPTRRGFGTTVMEAMTERSLDGTVELDYSPAGLTWCLTCSAANVLESSL
jgi:PAS domain S-box-containing protein